MPWRLIQSTFWCPNALGLIAALPLAPLYSWKEILDFQLPCKAYPWLFVKRSNNNTFSMLSEEKGLETMSYYKLDLRLTCLVKVSEGQQEFLVPFFCGLWFFSSFCCGSLLSIATFSLRSQDRSEQYALARASIFSGTLCLDVRSIYMRKMVVSAFWHWMLQLEQSDRQAKVYIRYRLTV